MHTHSLAPWQHDHAFGQQVRRAGERRTFAVVLLTAAMMAVEIGAGLAFGSMALLADGLHMGSHAAALGLAVVAYVYARRHAEDQVFTFGTGKVNALAGYSSALLLVLFAAAMAWESGNRLLQPQPIAFDEAILVALLGLAVNLVSLLMLRDAFADATTSLLAIAALALGRTYGWTWPDAAVGLVGALLVGRWAWGLVRDSGGVLLDVQAPAEVHDRIRHAIERGDDRVADLHVWSLGGDGYAAALSVVAHHPRSPEAYKAMIPASARVLHATVEVHHCN